jgi:hypothetical protein
MLIVFYILSTAIRLVLVYSAGDLPSIMTDELRYMHIAHSLITQGKVLFRGQPTAFTNLLYPLLISPLYLLPSGIDIFRAIQAENALLMHAAIFPAYALGLEITGNKKTALLLACMTVLLPDTVLVKNVMAESAAYPLILTALWMIIRALRAPGQTKRWIIPGVLCFLLYILKPAYTALGVSCVAVTGMYALGNRDRSRIKGLCVFIIVMAVCAAAYELWIRLALQVDPAQQSLYASQTAPFSFDHLLQALGGAPAYLYYYLIAFGILPVAALISAWRNFEGVRKQTALILLSMTFITILGTLYVIYTDELIHQSGIPLRIHIRYTAMLFPVYMMFLATDEMKGLRIGAAGILCAVAAGVGFALYSPAEMSARYPVDAAMIALLIYQGGAWNGPKMGLPLIVAPLAAIHLIALKNGLSTTVRRAFYIAITAIMIFNQAAAYQMNQFGKSPAQSADAREAVEMTDRSALMVCADGEETWAPGVAVDVWSRCEIPVLTFGDLLKCTQPDGTVTSAIQTDREDYIDTVMVNTFSIPDHLILDSNLMYSFVPANSTKAEYTSSKLYAVLPITSGKPWIHSALVGFEKYWVKEGSHFILYDPVIKAKGAMKLMFYAHAEKNAATLTLKLQGGQEQAFALTGELQWFSAEFTLSDPSSVVTVDFTTSGDGVYVASYLVE